MTRQVLLALLWLRLAQAKRVVRRPSTYVAGLASVGAVIGIQQLTGIGAGRAAARPDTHGSGVAMLFAIVLSLVMGGVTGPVLAIPPVEAQWLVTAPGGVGAKVVWRLLVSLLFRWSETVVLVIAAQVATGQPVRAGVANVLGLLWAGLDGTTSGLRYVAAGFYASHRRHWPYRFAAAAVLLPAVYLVSMIHPLMRALGRPGVDSGGAAYVSALGWLVVALLVAAIAMSRAESLVLRAVAAGDPRVRGAAQTRLMSKQNAAEPDVFRLHGAKVRLWFYITTRRRTGARELLLIGGACTAISGLSLTAPAWELAPLAAMIAFVLMAMLSPRPPGPASTDSRLLPFHAIVHARWAILWSTVICLEFLLAPLALATALGGLPSAAVLPAWLCLVPVSLSLAVLSWLPTLDNETPHERNIRIALLTGWALAPAVAVNVVLPGVGGAALAVVWLFLVSGCLLVYGIREIESALKPAMSD